MMAKTMQVEGGNYGIKEEKQRKKISICQINHTDLPGR